MNDHDAELDALGAQFVTAGMLVVGTDAEGHVTYTRTENGVRVACQLAMASDAAQDAPIDALLDAAGEEQPGG